MNCYSEFNRETAWLQAEALKKIHALSDQGYYGGRGPDVEIAFAEMIRAYAAISELRLQMHRYPLALFFARRPLGKTGPEETGKTKNKTLGRALSLLCKGSRR